MNIIDPAAQTAPASTSPVPTQSGADKTKLNADFDFFIKMLSAQLKNQDPLDPQDPSEFTQQLVQFSSVEQQIGMNEKLEGLLKSQDSAANLTALNYLGRGVEFSGNQLALQDGQAGLLYSLKGQAESVEVEIRDSAGRSVRSLQGGTQLGDHALIWDGKDQAGNPVADGAYTYTLKALSGDKAIAFDSRSLGIVDRVGSNQNGLTVNVGALEISQSQILGVRG